MTHKNKVLAVVGPTGSGKTALAVGLAKRFNGVILSADSRQVYRGLDVGTNKEGKAGLWGGEPARFIEGIPQLLIDIAEPGSRFTLHDWLQQASLALEQVKQSAKIAIVCGGTGLYVTALLEGYLPGEGRHAKTKRMVGFEALTLMPVLTRENLNKKSDERFVKLFGEIVAETRRLIERGVSAEWLDRIGLDYRYTVKYITGEMSQEEAIKSFQRASRHYVRRQLTWWRHHGKPHAVYSISEAVRQASIFLKLDPKALH